MYPGPNDTDWQVAKFQHRELVAMGLHQQFAASALASAPVPKGDRGPGSTGFRQQLGTLLVRVGQRLQGAPAVARECGVSTAPVELGAMA